MDIRPVKKVRMTPKPAAALSQPEPNTKPNDTKKKKPGLISRIRNHPHRNHPFVIPVTTFIFLFFLSLSVFIFSNGSTIGATDTRLVNLTIDGERRVIPTRATTVQDMLARLDIPVSEKDIVEPALDAEIIDTNFSVNVYTARAVTIIDGKKEVTTVTAVPTARGAAESVGIKVFPEDKVESRPELVETDDVLRGRPVAETILIERATPININLYGSNIPARTHVATVAEVLKEKNIQTQPDDQITPAPNTVLTANTQVFITRMGHTVSSREEVIPMVVETVNDPSLAVGRTIVKQQGNPGRKVVTYEVQLENDKEVARRPIQEIIAIEPVKHIVVKGTKPPTVIVSGDHATLMLQAGIPESQHGSAEYIISHESRWRLDARNSSGCLGLGQACPGSKLINACPEYANDPICQLRFFTNYVNGRYGSWNGAYNFWVVNHWY